MRVEKRADLKIGPAGCCSIAFPENEAIFSAAAFKWAALEINSLPRAFKWPPYINRTFLNATNAKKKTKKTEKKVKKQEVGRQSYAPDDEGGGSLNSTVSNV